MHWFLSSITDVTSIIAMCNENKNYTKPFYFRIIVKFEVSFELFSLFVCMKADVLDIETSYRSLHETQWSIARFRVIFIFVLFSSVILDKNQCILVTSIKMLLLTHVQCYKRFAYINQKLSTLKSETGLMPHHVNQQPTRFNFKRRSICAVQQKLTIYNFCKLCQGT